jgi:hypothetical protein
LQEKHPEVWHEVARDAIVWIVEQDLHLPISGSELISKPFSCTELRKRGKRRRKNSIPMSQEAFASRCTITHVCGNAHNAIRSTST